ncbi:hypothetical protein N8612_05485 [Verrucomicrobia bacterium]|nr:hypothetical protein [Verrucomicrobiota bacterium]
MKVRKLFQRTLFGIFLLFGFIGLSTSILCVYTVDTHLTEEYQNNSKAIAQTIADSSVDILLNRDLSSLQSLIDQYTEIQGIKYIFITDEAGAILAHTFVPGIPSEIRNANLLETEMVERHLLGLGDFMEVGSPILTGEAGTVHVGMDTGLIGLKIQRAIGRQVYLISFIFVIGIFAAVWCVNLAAKPIGELLDFGINLAPRVDGKPMVLENYQGLLARKDEVGQLARLFLYYSKVMDEDKARQPSAEKDAAV